MTQRNRKDRFASLFAVEDPSLLCKAEMEQVRHVLSASTAVQTCSASVWMSVNGFQAVRAGDRLSGVLDWEHVLAERC